MTKCKLGRFIVYNFAEINDHKKFDSRPLRASENPFVFQALAESQFSSEFSNIAFEELLKNNKTVAFLVIHRDTIIYERYFNKYNQQDIVPSFSMAKSITSMLIGCAIDDGLIQSIQEPVTKYISELSKNGFDQVTIEQLLQMTSGLDFNEGYFNPFGEAASFYYGLNLRKEINKLKLKAEPGSAFEYVSGNTQLLGLVLERALKNKSITT